SVARIALSENTAEVAVQAGIIFPHDQERAVRRHRDCRDALGVGRIRVHLELGADSRAVAGETPSEDAGPGTVLVRSGRLSRLPYDDEVAVCRGADVGHNLNAWSVCVD